MAMRARGAGVNPNRPRRAVVGRVYEQFKPMSEWRQEDDHDSLLVYLPGFQKEFIKVTTEDPSILRVRGEHLVSGNKWSRFQEDFQVPQSCKMTGIRAKFDSGILVVTMPRKTIDPPTTTTTTTTTATAPKPQEPTQGPTPNKDPSNALSSSTKQENDSGKATSSSTIKKGDEETKKDTLNLALEALEKPTRPQTTLDATLLPPPPFVNRSEAKEKPTRPNQTPLDATLLPQPPFANHSEAKEKPTRPSQAPLDATRLPQPPSGSKPLLPSLEKPNNQEVKPLDRAKEKEPVTEKTTKTKRDLEQNTKVIGNGGFGSHKLEELKRVIKGVAMGGMKEERELLVNMGVAVLVIVAVGAYVNYTIGSSSKGN